MLNRFTVLVSAFLPVLASEAAKAEIVLPGVFSDHAVLQRAKPIHVWGASKPGEVLRIRFREQVVEVTASPLGQWEAHLRPERAGGPFTLAVESPASGERVERTDILVGDVWFASGQSNMEMPLEGFPKSSSPVNGGEKAIASARNPRLRLLLQARRVGMAPMWDTQDRWAVSSPESARGFSAVAYSFAQRLIEKNGVPVGVIAASWGGTPAHAWISAEGIGWANLPSVAIDAGVIARQQALVDRVRANHAVNPEVPDADTPRLRDHRNSYVPSVLYNGMIAPYTGYTISGWLWYQGETDANEIRPAYYSRVFPALIQDWRKQWGQGDLPFLYVQLSGFGRGGASWGQVRDAQRQAGSLVNTGMAVSLDLGAEDNIHPPEKFVLGHRLAAMALSMTDREGKSRDDSRSPKFRQATAEGAVIRAWFDHARGLHGSGSGIGAFEVAGDDGRFVPAQARIETIDGAATVAAQSPLVPAPKYIRYGWSAFVRDYLFNAAGLPLGTFTSESDTLSGLRF